MHLGLRGKVAVVTGASRGIGKAVAQALLQEGCSVAICSRNAERLEMTVTELSATGPVFGVSTDVTDEKAVQRFIDAALRQFGRIDILVNNAGTHLRGTVETTTLDILERQMRDKVFGFFSMIKAVLPTMKAQRGILEFSFRDHEPGIYMFHAHVSEFADLGWMSAFDVR